MPNISPEREALLALCDSGGNKNRTGGFPSLGNVALCLVAKDGTGAPLHLAGIHELTQPTVEENIRVAVLSPGVAETSEVVPEEVDAAVLFRPPTETEKRNHAPVALGGVFEGLEVDLSVEGEDILYLRSTGEKVPYTRTI